MAGKNVIDIEIETKDVRLVLDRLDTCFSPVGLAFFLGDKAVPMLARRAEGRFQAEGDETTGPWEALASTTVQRRERGIRSGEYAGISPEHPINIRTRDMYDYITKSLGTIEMNGDNVTLHFPKKGAHLGDMRYKVGTAQRGHSNGAPPRPVLVVGAQDVADLANDLVGHIVKGVQGGKVT